MRTSLGLTLRDTMDLTNDHDNHLFIYIVPKWLVSGTDHNIDDNNNFTNTDTMGVEEKREVLIGLS